MARLNGPRSRRRICRIEAREIEIERRVHNPNTHQFAPDKVYRGAGKLWIFGQHARIRFAPGLTVAGRFGG